MATFCLGVVGGCSKQLRPVQRAELLSLPEDTAAQGASLPPATDPRAHVTPARSWRVFSSSNDHAFAAQDGDPHTVLVTPDDHGNEQWLLVDLGEPCRFQSVRQIHPEVVGAPRRYRIDVAGAKGFPWKLQWVGAGSDGESLAVFRHPAEARFLRITVLEEGSTRWGVGELEIF